MKQQIIKPKVLKTGDTIGVVMPASGVSRECLEHITISLKEQGYLVKIAANAESVHGYLAGTDEQRAQAFMDIWLDPEVDVIWCARGGYGSGRLLPYLDFKKLQKHPKMFIGMSDITALHSAVGQKALLLSYLGPNLFCLFNKEKKTSDFTWKSCWSFLTSFWNTHTYTYPIEVVNPGVGEGLLVGGNLSLVTSLIGTPWAVDTERTILVLEDVNEPPYKIDRMLNQLKLSGALNRLAGVILGTFEGCYSAHPLRTLTLVTIFNDYFADRSYPVIMGFPTGHGCDQVILPLHCEVRLDAQTKTITVLESAMQERSRKKILHNFTASSH